MDLLLTIIRSVDGEVLYHHLVAHLLVGLEQQESDACKFM